MMNPHGVTAQAIHRALIDQAEVIGSLAGALADTRKAAAKVSDEVAAFLDSLDPAEAGVSWDHYSTAQGVTVQLYRDDSTIPRRMVAAGIVARLDKAPAWDGRSLTLTGQTEAGAKITIRGYLGACRVETYQETVTKSRVLCGPEAETV